ncbi:hypothetical protein Vadar_004224 [Vaccinium darrowii]|uniref:Uncharacterized protein n=1 Tax=Vaccinium darrowii TaxID=229202 RepID=A0ACB7YCR5_9ERIC|nr:hypothetical protein Vadar_004224 [Vaccinium darrowii]
MVKAKHQKPKPHKHIKKHGGKQGDISAFRAQLDALGLKIIEVTADGNCFFRAFADQVEGNEEEHQRYRSMVVQFMLDNRDMFEPFIEDDASFEEYCKSMKEDGTWAGNMELQAASLVTRSNICIHRSMSPRWYIRNFGSHARMVHLSYHDWGHYNSVRLTEDNCTGPARPIIIKADADPSAKSCEAKVPVTKSKGGGGKNLIHADSIKLVKAGSGCGDAKKVEQVLQQVGGDVDAANEFLIAEQATEDYLAESDELSRPTDTSHGVYENGNYEQQPEELKDNSCNPEQSCDKETTHSSLHQDEKKIARNKVCPCGSKKKYKACCGSVSGKSSKFAMIQTVDYSKSRKGRKQVMQSDRMGNTTKEKVRRRVVLVQSS